MAMHSSPTARRRAPVPALLPGLLALAVIAGSGPLHAQPTVPAGDGLRSGPLYDELARLDMQLFDASFVTCDAAKANALFADDVEFFHDKDGLSVGEQVRENTRRLTASCPGRHGVTRTLIPGTLRVYPIKDYGAMQVGAHRFDERGNPSSTVAQFISVWHRQGDTWRLAKVFSFDHQAVPAAAASGK